MILTLMIIFWYYYTQQQLMKIQKQKILTNLIKLRIIKNKYLEIQGISVLMQFLQSLFIVYFIIIHTQSHLENPLFAYLKQCNIYLSQFISLPFIFSTILLLINLVLLLSIIFLMILEKKKNPQQKERKIKNFFVRVMAYTSLLFDFVGPILIVLVISNLAVTNMASIGDNFANILSIALSQLIIIYCNETIIFSRRLIFVMLSFLLFAGLFPYTIVICSSIYELVYNTKDKLSYLVFLTINVTILLAEMFEADITTLQMGVILASIAFIYIFLPKTMFSENSGNENDFLLKSIEKLGKDVELKSEEIIKIVFIFQNLILKYQEYIEPEVFQKIQSILVQHFTKQFLIELLLLKLKIESDANPKNMCFYIQKYECKLLEKAFSISTLYLIEKLRVEVADRGLNEELMRMESLISKIEVNYLRSEEEINSAFIFSIEKQIELFYQCIGSGIEELLALWTTTFHTVIDQNVFSHSLKKVISLQAKSEQILAQLKAYKNIDFQIQIINYLHRIISIDGNNLVEPDQPVCNQKLKETKFILVSNHIIEDISHIIAKQISNHSQCLIGMRISEVLYDFYNTYLQEQRNELISITQSHNEILIPFKVLDHDKKFILAECTFCILPNLSEGVKYIINFCKQKEYIKKYTLYCLEDDNIKGLSQTFYEKQRIDENSLPQILLGRQIFNIDLSNYINAQDITKGFKIKCELKILDLKKKEKTLRRIKSQHFIQLTLVVRDHYKVNNLNFILFEMVTRDETLIPNAKQAIKIFVAQSNTNHGFNGIGDRVTSPIFCKINNPLESIIDDKLSRINNSARISYYKIIIWLILIIFFLLIASLIYMKIQTQNSSDQLNSQLSIIQKKNALIQTTYQLFYQYYQYYQIKNFPQQILQIQKYNVTAMVKEYYNKANANIAIMLPLIINNKSPYISSNYTIFYSNFSTIEETSAINLVDFLQGTKLALATNSPIFIVRNQKIIYQIIDSIIPSDNKVIENMLSSLHYYLLGMIVSTIAMCIIIKILYFRLNIFKWKLFQVYSLITPEEITSYTKKLEEFVEVLIQTKYYQKREDNYKQSQIYSDNDLDYKWHQKTQKTLSAIQSKDKVKGIKRASFFQKLLDKNLIFLVPFIILSFFMIYQGEIQAFTTESKNILDYQSELQTFFVIVLERATQYFQAAMQVILPEQQRKGWQRQQKVTIPTELTAELPSFFDNYKALESNMLNYNLCAYSYLNTGSLYKNINCSQILDGMMDNGFTESYTFLLQKLEQFGGVYIQDLGKQFRPHAIYPFYMEVCYARRTINNMVAYIQVQFNTAVNGYLSYQQAHIQSIINIGFYLIPIIMIIIWIFLRQIKAECNFAIKCFKIIPRKFIMKISMSKKLMNNGVLNEIELIAA